MTKVPDMGVNTLMKAFWVILLVSGVTQAQENPPQSKPPEDPIITATFKDGIKMKSSDGNFEAAIGGHVYVHYRQIFNRPDDAARTSADTFFLKQARPEISGTLYKDWEYKLQYDFPTGATSASAATAQDVYFGWKPWPEFGIRIGQFKEPFGQEQTVPDPVVDFAERGEQDRLVPARDIGFMFHGKIASGLFSYEAASFNGSGRSVTDGNDEKDVALRLRTMPFVSSDDPFLKNLRLGVAGTIGDHDRASINGLDFSTGELSILFLDATTGFLDGRRTRLGAELTWNVGPVGVKAEVIRRADEVDVGTLDNKDIDSTGWMASASWLVTGETKPIEQKVTPTEVFDAKAGTWGALEVAFRVAELKVDEDIFSAGIASSTANSNQARSYTLAANWYPNRNIRVGPNFAVETFDDPVRFSDGKTEDRFYGALVRFQLDF